jgi:hypothetical protein
MTEEQPIAYGRAIFQWMCSFCNEIQEIDNEYYEYYKNNKDFYRDEPAAYLRCFDCDKEQWVVKR